MTGKQDIRTIMETGLQNLRSSSKMVKNKVVVLPWTDARYLHESFVGRVTTVGIENLTKNS
jgi:hypothetical protein